MSNMCEQVWTKLFYQTYLLNDMARVLEIHVYTTKSKKQELWSKEMTYFALNTPV